MAVTIVTSAAGDGLRCSGSHAGDGWTRDGDCGETAGRAF